MLMMTAKQYREENFAEGSRPDIATIRGWIKRGELPGKKIGGTYYVLVEDVEKIEQPERGPNFTRYAS